MLVLQLLFHDLVSLPLNYHLPLLVFNIQINHFHQNSNSGQFFRIRDLCSFSLLGETNNFGLVPVLLPSLVSKVQKTSSPGLEPTIVFPDCDLCFCNLLIETNNFGLGAVLLSCLISELQEPPSLGLELRTIFRSFDLSKISSWFQGLSIPILLQISLYFLEL
jgi:hypothetical protein